ncbi:S8 family serine peptidase [Actinomadura sp. WMMB 499]|uniref:S8 family serine peptidase n=1 Tax=Actinomadura sp. WMMB 499 TaxID=1219491 RepID=UPI0012461F91|nr:S8 family serine peptidase [Actinomadura sp. WMMB 499]QFG27426.1 S8 family serine peptidase [Actinomadura sp. WMMB 499]
MLRRAALRGAAVLTACALVWTPGTARADEVRDRQQPVLDDLGVDEAWKLTRGEGVTVAVVDSGVDPGHADLRGSVTVGPNLIEETDAGTEPERLHGTAMASLIAGHGHGPGGRDGIIGIAPRARILSIRSIAEEEDAGYARFRREKKAERAVAEGIRYAADHGADVINLSLGQKGQIPAERQAIAYAMSKGIVVVSAVGNDGDDPDALDRHGFAPYSYPASYPGVIAVAASRPGGGRAPFSNSNYSVLVAAPGAELPVALPGGRYVLSSGTSDSSAIVSGIAALLKAEYPELSPALVAQAIVDGTRNGPEGTYDARLGFGVVHAARSLSAAAELVRERARTTAGKPPGDAFGGAEPEPVPVIERPAWFTGVLVTVVGGVLAGTIAAVWISALFARRHPRGGRPPVPGPGPGGGPPPLGLPGLRPAPEPWRPGGRETIG